MSTASSRYDLVVIGAGPAGQKAAVQGAKAGARVLLIERGASLGGECVHRGTIPSKTLRETAVYLSGLRRRSEGVLRQEIPADLKIESLMRRQDAVREAHEGFLARQLERNHIDVWSARAVFTSPRTVEALHVDGTRRTVEAGAFVIATGSRPRTPANVPVDHERVLDSDSILSLIYLPASLIVLGAGVIACEYASMFAALGVQVTIVDRGERPMPFLDQELSQTFVEAFERAGGRYLHGTAFERVESTPFEGVTVVLPGGESLRAEKLVCALGRVASVAGLGLEAIGLAIHRNGHIEVDQHLRTAVPGIYAAGDVIGPPALAATSMEQGRRAARHALGLEVEDQAAMFPVGIYTIPEMAAVGMTEAEAASAGHEAVVGRARFGELARGQICGDTTGMLKLVAEAGTGRVLGAHIAGEAATELVHVAQMAMIAGLTADTFVEHTFNFPTMAEAYRVAGLDIEAQRAERRRAA